MTVIPSVSQNGLCELLPKWEVAHLRRSFRRVTLSRRMRLTPPCVTASPRTSEGFRRTIKLVKLDERGIAMPGARFRLTKGSGRRGQSIFSVPETGRMETVELGTVYCLAEIEAPTGYAMLVKKIYFEVTPHGIEARKRRGAAFVSATWQDDYDSQVTVGGEGRMTINVMNHPSRVPVRTKGSGGAPFMLTGATRLIDAAVTCGPFQAYRLRREVA